MIDEFDFNFHQLLYGGFPADHIMRIGHIPYSARLPRGWQSRNVFLTAKDAQKIRFHKEHGMDGLEARAILTTVEKGDYYRNPLRGTDLQIEVILHDPEIEKRCHFLVLARDKDDNGFFIRTFYRSNNISRSKLKGATRILRQSQNNYFKDVKDE
ncbi:MAG: hypothetical protein MUD11_08990 [Rhodobacteraceae bacterium]|nr:hypothetical protein [Paracoccaceae bacterium]